MMQQLPLNNPALAHSIVKILTIDFLYRWFYDSSTLF